MAQPRLQRFHRADHVKALPRAAGARYHTHAARAQAKRFQDFKADAHFFFGFGRERDADRVADPCPQQIAHADRRFHRAADQSARLGNAQMERAIHRVGQTHVRRHRKEHIAGFHRDLKLVKIVILEQLDMIKRAFHQRLGAGLAIFVEQVFLKAARVHPDADRAAIGLGRAHHFGHAFAAADIAGIDPQACRARIGGFQRALIMEMDIGHDRNARGAHDLAQRGGAFHIGARNADDIRARILAAADLVDRGDRIAGQRVGHRLHRDRRVAAHRNGADHDLARCAARDIAPGAYGCHARAYSRRMGGAPPQIALQTGL